ncbi:MAG: nucleotide exchange factor GrpE [Porphyromonas sp.]|nr:nucleotide exchange factor GrpE [Porphyromonas sp.]
MSTKKKEEKDIEIEKDAPEADLPNEDIVEEAVEEQVTLEQRLAELEDSHLRLRAEYDNFRKRTLKEKSELIRTAGERILTQFIGVADDFDLAVANLSQATDVAAVAEGIDIIRTKFISAMKAQGVSEMEVLGEPFDADLYDAVGMFPVEDADKKGKVIECVQKGYTLNDKVIRHPKVIVGQ